MKIEPVGDRAGHMLFDPGEHIGDRFLIRSCGELLADVNMLNAIEVDVPAGHIQLERIDPTGADEYDVLEIVEAWAYISPIDFLPTEVAVNGTQLTYQLPVHSIDMAVLMLLGTPIERETKAPIVVDIDGVMEVYGPVWGSATYYGCALDAVHCEMLGGHNVITVGTLEPHEPLALKDGDSGHGVLTVHHLG